MIENSKASASIIDGDVATSSVASTLGEADVVADTGDVNGLCTPASADICVGSWLWKGTGPPSLASTWSRLGLPSQDSCNTNSRGGKLNEVPSSDMIAN
jgi:hypothetical protein